MIPDQIFAVLYGFIACIGTTIGIFIIWKYREWGQKHTVYFISFAAGLLITVSILHLIPESLELNVNAPIFLLIGFLSLHLFDRFLDNHTFNNTMSNSGSITTKRYSLGIISAWGIGVHSFVDGVIFMVTFSISTFTGIATSTALVFHEIPEGIITFLLLKEAGFSEKKSAIYAFIAAGISTPMGAIVAYPFVYSLGTQQLGILLALAAGALLYVGASRLLPESEKGSTKYSLITLGLGILIALVIVMSH